MIKERDSQIVYRLRALLQLHVVTTSKYLEDEAFRLKTFTRCPSFHNVVISSVGFQTVKYVSDIATRIREDKGTYSLRQINNNILLKIIVLQIPNNIYRMK